MSAEPDSRPHRRQADDALRESRAQLEAELAATRLLASVSTELIREQSIEAVYQKIMDAAVGIMRSDFASMQMLYPERGEVGELRLLAFRGFDAQTSKFWEWVRADSSCTCGVALRTLKRTIATDVRTCEFMSGTDDQATYVKGGILAVQSTPLISRTGALVGMISTHWKQPHEPAERELRLLDVLARQAADLIDRMKAEEALRDYDRRKDEFLAVLSHELRNPLAPLRSALELLRLNEDNSRTTAIREVMERQVNHLVRLVDDLLEVSRITHGTFGLLRERVDLTEVVRNALETSQPNIKAANHRLSVSLPEEPLWVHGDSVRLAQIFANLLNNAARYTPKRGQISVRARREDGHAVVSVLDDGAGIAPQDMPRLFEMFSRGMGSTGLGIGLALARRLAEMHDGTIVAASEGTGKGAEFTVRLPLAAAKAESKAQPIQAPTPLLHKRILVVDDNQDAADSLTMLLQGLGAEVHAAHCGEDALAAFKAYQPGVVLLDLAMPGIDGYEVARTLRRSNGERVRLVALTGSAQEADRKRSRDAGFDYHLVKPASIGTLQSLLASLV